MRAALAILGTAEAVRSQQQLDISAELLAVQTEQLDRTVHVLVELTDRWPAPGQRACFPAGAEWRIKVYRKCFARLARRWPMTPIKGAPRLFLMTWSP